MKLLSELFTEHPREVGMSYFGHFKYSTTVTVRLFVYAYACLIHTFFPFLFTHTISDFISRIHAEFNNHLSYNAKGSDEI